MYTGNERRNSDVGRRVNDREFCALHNLLQDEAKESRSTTCGKIKTMKEDVLLHIARIDEDNAKLKGELTLLERNIVGKFWFKISLGAVFSALLYMAYQQNWSIDKILDNQKQFSVVINSIENKQVETVQKLVSFEKAVEVLEKRQDILRDYHMKHMQDTK